MAPGPQAHGTGRLITARAPEGLMPAGQAAIRLAGLLSRTRLGSAGDPDSLGAPALTLTEPTRPPAVLVNVGLSPLPYWREGPVAT